MNYCKKRKLQLKIQGNIDKISWSFLDKVLFVLYGIITVVQFKYIDPYQIGLYTLLINLTGYLLLISDSFALQGMIQFGQNQEIKSKVDTIALSLFVGLTLIFSATIFFSRLILSEIFNNNNLAYVYTFFPIIALLTIPRAFFLKIQTRIMNYKNYFLINLVYFGTLIIGTLALMFKYNFLDFQNLVYLNICACLSSAIFGFMLGYKEFSFSLKGEITYKEYLNFSVPMTIVSAFHSMPRMLDVYIIQYSFPPQIASSVVGVYNSAKTIYRVFDEAIFASNALIYPAAVKHIQNENKQAVKALFTKAVSFIFFIFVLAFLVFETGIVAYLITHFLPVKYHSSIGMLKVLVWAALALPFTLLIIVVTASNKPKLVLKYVLISSLISMLTFYLAGKTNNSDMIPLGVVAYNLSLGILSMYYFKKHFGFDLSDLFRAFSDTINFIKKKK